MGFDEFDEVAKKGKKDPVIVAAEELVARHSFATLRDTDEILWYHDGTYEHLGETRIREALGEGVRKGDTASSPLCTWAESLGASPASSLQSAGLMEVLGCGQRKAAQSFAGLAPCSQALSPVLGPAPPASIMAECPNGYTRTRTSRRSDAWKRA